MASCPLMQRVAMQVVDSRRLADPPLMRLESEGGHAYLSMLLQLSASQTQKDEQAEVEARLVTLALATLQRFQVRASCHFTSPSNVFSMKGRLATCCHDTHMGYSD